MVLFNNVLYISSSDLHEMVQFFIQTGRILPDRIRPVIYMLNRLSFSITHSVLHSVLFFLFIEEWIRSDSYLHDKSVYLFKNYHRSNPKGLQFDDSSYVHLLMAGFR